MLLNLVLPVVVLAVPTVAAGMFLAAGKLAPIDPRKLEGESGGRSFYFGLVAIFIVLGGLGEYALCTSMAANLPALVAQHPREFWRWFNPVLEFSAAASVFCGVGAHALNAWWRFSPEKRAT